MGHRRKGELFPAQPSGKMEPKGLSTWGHPALSPARLLGEMESSQGTARGRARAAEPVSPGSEALQPLSPCATGPGVAPRSRAGKEEQDVALLALSLPSWRDR